MMAVVSVALLEARDGESAHQPAIHGRSTFDSGGRGRTTGVICSSPGPGGGYET